MSKLVYSAPKAEVLVVQAEGVICWSISNPTKLVLFSDWGDSNAAGADLIEDAGYNL